MQSKLKLLVIVNVLLCVLGCSSMNTSNSKSKPDVKTAALLNVEMGESYLEMGQVSRAKSKFVHALELAPNLPESNAGLAYFYETVGDLADAEKYYKKSLHYSGGKAVFFNNYAMYLCRNNRFKEADKAFNSAIKDKFYDKTAEVYENMGHCALRAGNIDNADLYLHKAVQHDPKLSGVHLEIAELAFTRGNYQESNKALTAFKSMAKPLPRSLWLAIQLAAKEQDNDSVASNALKLRNLFPDSEEYKLYNTYFASKK